MLKDFSKYLPAMRLLDDVLFKLAGKQDLFSTSIKLAADNNTPALTIIRTIASQAKGNYIKVADMLGNSLTDKILAL